MAMGIQAISKRPAEGAVKPSRSDDDTRSAALAPILLAIVTIAALWPVCINDFTFWDDQSNISLNPLFNPVTVRNVWHFWSHPYISLYIPLTYTVWGALSSIARVGPDAEDITLNPYVFHSTNLLVHVAAVFVAFQILRLLTRRTWPSAMGALLFALHPMQIEPVAWITGLKDVLCGVLSLVAIWQYILYAQPEHAPDPPRSTRIRATHYSVATAAFILAMLAKPSAVTVPLAVVMIDRFLLRRSWRQVAIAIAPWMVLAFACAAFGRVVQPVRIPADGGRIWARPLLAGAALAFYLYKLIWPARLAVLYCFSPDVLLAGHWIWFAWIVPVAIGLGAWRYRKRQPWLLASAGLIFCATLPVLGFTPFIFESYSLVADRFFYMAMLGPALALSFMLASPALPKIAWVLCAAWLGALGVRSFFQTAYWRDSVTLFTHELAVNPQCAEAYNVLGDRALARHDVGLGEQLARQSLLMQPIQINAYVTLATAFVAEGRPKDAIPLYALVCEHDPDNVKLLHNYVGLLANESLDNPQQLAEAERLSRMALEKDPLSAQGHHNRAIILLYQRHMEEALLEAQTSVQLNATDPHSQTTLAYLLEQNHEHEDAIRHATLALQLDPNFVPARDLLAKLARPPG